MDEYHMKGESDAYDLRSLFLLAIVLAVLFFSTEHMLLYSRIMRQWLVVMDTNEKLATMEQGSWLRKASYIAIAVIGLFWLMRRNGRPWQRPDALPLLALAGLTWCGISVFWSDRPDLTGRRVALLICASLGALGLARRYSLRELAVLTSCVTGFYVLLGFSAEIALGTFQPWIGWYRFAGTLHPNGQAAYCACFCIAIACLCIDSRRKHLLIPLLIAGLVMLYLTKARTSLVACLISLSVLWVTKASVRTKVLGGSALGFAVCSLLFLVLLAGSQGALQDLALLGRPESVDTLGSWNGRVPLWTEILMPYVHSRPILGYGYDTFWTPERILDVAALNHGWLVNSAHNSYVESIVSTGLVGGGLLVLVLTVGWLRAYSRFRINHEAGYAFVLALLTFGIVQGIAESYFIRPTAVPFMAVAGLFHLAFFEKRSGPGGCEMPEEDS